MLFLEPRIEQQMLRFCEEVPGKSIANRLEGGTKPLLSTARRRTTVFAPAADSLIMYSMSAFAMRQALLDLQAGHTPEQMLSFEEIKTLVGFNSYLK